MRQYEPGQDIFQTSTDTRFNSFTDPSAMAFNQQRGNWGVNPNLMTPSYTAAYRPSYNGNQGNPYGRASPGYAQSINQVFNPLASGGSNYGGNYMQQQSPYFDTLGFNPMDSAMNFSQRWMIPAAASFMAYRHLAKPMGQLGSRMAAGVATGLMGSSFSAGTTATVGSMAGGLGRFAGALAGPMLASEAVVWAADKIAFDPFIAQRQMHNDMRRNFAGVTFADGSGNDITGKGFSRFAAARQATKISVMGAKDYTFNQSEVSNLTDLSARSGLLDTVSGGQISDRMKTIVKQVKTVMQIGNTSDFKEAIEILSKLQTSGVASRDVTSVLGRLGGAASVAGVSLQKMMGTVGAQGEYMFAANNMTPYVGQLMAANSYGAFSAAQRAGILSPSMLARMGGVEGATQSSVAGMVGMAQTPYSGFEAYNRYRNGGSTGSLVSEVSKFGAAMSKDPLDAIGEFNYTRAELASKSLENGGLRRQMENVQRIMKSSGRGVNADGTLKRGAAFHTLTQVMGLPEEAARAVMSAQYAAQDPAAAALTSAGLISSFKESRLKSMQQEGFSYGPLTGIIRPTTIMANEAIAASSGFIGKRVEGVSRFIDHAEAWMTGTATGNLEDVLGGGSTPSINTENMRSNASLKGINRHERKALVEKFKDLEKDPGVMAALKSGKASELNDAVFKAALNNPNLKEYTDKSARANIVGILLKQGLSKGSDKKNSFNVKYGSGAADLLSLIEEVSSGGGGMSEASMKRLISDTGDKSLSIDDYEGGLTSLTRAAALATGKSADIANKLSYKDFSAESGLVTQLIQTKRGLADSEKNVKDKILGGTALTEVKDMNVSAKSVTINVQGAGGGNVISNKQGSLQEWGNSGGLKGFVTRKLGVAE